MQCKLWQIVLMIFVSLLLCLGLVYLLAPSIFLKPLADLVLDRDLEKHGVNLSSQDIEKLRNNDPEVKDIVFRQINNLLKEQFKGNDTTVLIEEGDIQIEAEYPDKEFSSSCSLWVTAFHPRVRGSLLNSSNISSGLDFDHGGVQAFMEATVDGIVNVDLDFRVEIGAKIFKKCRRARDTLGINLTTTGKVLIAIRISGTNVRIETEDNNLVMKFDLAFELEGKPFDWNVDNVDVSKCDVKVGNKVKIGSYCSLVTDLIKEGAQKYLDKWTIFEAPKLVEKLENKLRKKVGEEMSFPIIKF